jgi:uncharacterized membrane protein
MRNVRKIGSRENDCPAKRSAFGPMAAATPLRYGENMSTTATQRRAPRENAGDVRARSKPVLHDAIKVTRAITIRKTAAELYAFWRDLPNLTRVIKHPVSIIATSRDESHWVVSAPGGKQVQWDAIIIKDEPNHLISWRSREGGDVANAGSVWFEPAPTDEGTEVKVSMQYDPPAGKLGAFVAKLTRDAAGSQVGDALRRLKALLEVGEIPTIDGQSVGGPQRPRKGEK